MTSPRPCPGLAVQRSALLDGALRDADRERLLAHLVHCPGCRADLAELGRVRSLLGTARPDPAAPPALTARLVGIAGDTSGSTAPTVRPAGPRRGRRVAVAALTAASLAVLGAAVGYAAAPTGTPAGVDPGPVAAGEFVAATAAMPLAMDAVQAVASPDASALATPTVVLHPREPAARTRPAGAAAARRTLERAASAAGRVSYGGRQEFWALVAGRAYAGWVDVVAAPGQGRRASVLDRAGHPVGSWLTPARPSRLTDDELVGLLANRWRLSARTGDRVAGRAATLVEARSPTGGAVAVRWWVDDATGLLLAQEAYGSGGTVTLRARFASVRTGAAGPGAGHYSPRTAVPVATASLTTSAADQLQRDGWVCPDEVAGLPLLRVHTDALAAPSLLHLVYSDGVSTVSVVQQRGRMAEPPPDAVFDPSLDGWRRPGTPPVVTWSSGDAVVAVAAAGEPDLLARAAADLPRLPAVQRTTMGRVHAGWVRIVDALNG